jgi:O-antigen ligase
MIPFIRYIKKSDKQIVVAFFLVLGYVLVLAFFQHYYWYLKMNRLNIAMQGRYLLPVIPAAYLIEVWSLTKIRNDRFKKLILIVILLIFLCGNVFIFTKSIIYGGAEWYPNLFNSI